MDVLSAAKAKERQGGDIVHMEVGQPSAPSPARVLEAAQAALAGGHVGYTEALGLPSLRQRIARHYRDAYGVDVSPERVVVTTGSSGGFVLAFLALFEPGARVAVAQPGYPAYRNIFAALDIETVAVDVSATDNWVLGAHALGRADPAHRLSGLLAMSPANPTGTMIPGAELAELAAVSRRRGLWFISDEIYHGLTYEAPAQTALAFDADAVVVNSFSKYYCMTGWRVGWLVVPERLVRPIERLAQNLYISPPYLSQVAAEAAFDATAELEAVRAVYAANRALLLHELPRMGLTVAPIDGAFYAYVDVSRWTDDSHALCQQMLEEIGVAATPGLDFDPERGPQFLRLSFAGSHETCRECMRRLRGWLQRR
ncbi:pyridoxal phosphate-dependent aminotransferase [Chelatococcus reniformis]|nr:aminotransferase class I/II-fold pyridoxal phosphate-dependent enzyme [Chelatococcus reniformis]